MPVDPSFAGRAYPPTEPFLVGREKITAFAEAIGADDPAHRDPAAARALGHPDVVAPPTFPIVLTLGAGEVVVADPALGLDYSRVVHADQRFAYARAIVAGDELRCVCTVEEVMSRAGNDFLTIRTDVLDTADALVVTAWTRLVARGSVSLVVIAWQEGQELPPQTYRVTRADLVRYAHASGDDNPIHQDDVFARSVGLPGVIAHGMYTMALAGRALAAWTGRPDAVVEYGVRFTKPVVVPDDEAGAEVVVGGTVRTVSDDRAQIDLTVTSGGEKVLAQARATVTG